MYHRITARTHDPWRLAVSPEHFDEHLRALAELGRVVRLEREMRRARTTRLGRRDLRLALTFDDGYVDNLRVALPILERHDAPATVFIATGFLDQPNFWWDRLAALVFSDSATSSEVAAAATAVGLLETQGAPCDRRETLHRRLWEQLVCRERVEIDSMLNGLAAVLEEPGAALDSRPMTTDELVELSTHPLISIGAHTVDHRRLTSLDDKLTLSEIVEGSAQLDALIGPSARSFAYPFGEAAPSTARLARQAGFDHAVTTRRGWVSAFDDRRLLPRLHATDIGGAEFGQWIRGPAFLSLDQRGSSARDEADSSEPRSASR